MRLILYCILILFLYINSFTESNFYPTPNSLIIPEKGITVFPESEKPLNFIVLGNDNRAFISIKNNSLKSNKYYLDIQKELWMLGFEFEHGRIINSLPSYTKIYFAITKKKEKDFFTEYLIKKCGFKQKDIKKRVFFFNVPSPCLWLQDTGEILGMDEYGHILLFNNPDDSYGFVLNSLFKYFSKIFQLRTNKNLSVEGGDIEITWNVNRKGILVFIGRHRILEYLRRIKGIDYSDKAILPEEINDIKNLYREIFNLPVKVIPEKMLLEPSKAENELFRDYETHGIHFPYNTPY